jgi:hypothetical protein
MAICTIVNAVLIEIGVPSRTGKIYSLPVCQKIASCDVLYGELISSYTNDNYITIDLAQASHVIKNMQIVNNQLIGDVTILDTPAGRMLDLKINECVLVPRGAGQIDENMNVSDYNIVAFDYISN